jgi:hypothetical protein
MKSKTEEKLDRLYEARQREAVLDEEKKKAIDSILTPEIRQQIADIEAEFQPQYQAANEAKTVLESEIKMAVIDARTTAQGQFLECTFAEGRKSWDTKGLDKLIPDYPWLSEYKKQGEPYASIRARK